MARIGMKSKDGGKKRGTEVVYTGYKKRSFIIDFTIEQLRNDIACLTIDELAPRFDRFKT